MGRGEVPLKPNPNSTNVIHHQSNIQPLEPLRNPLEIDIRSISVRNEVPHIPTIRKRLPQLIDHRMDLSLVPPMDDQVKPLTVQLPRERFPNPVRRTGDQRVRPRTGEVLPIRVRRTEEIEPDEIEEAFEVVETEQETDDGERRYT